MPAGIGVDSSGNAYVAGDTYSTNFPTTPGAFQQTATAIPCFHFPIGYIPFTSTYSIEGSGQVLVGVEAPGFASGLAAVPLPNMIGPEAFCEEPIQLAPGVFLDAQVPTAAERDGDFSSYEFPAYKSDHPATIPRQYDSHPGLRISAWPSATASGRGNNDYVARISLESAVSPSPPSLAFGTQNVGVPSAPLTETLTNTGTDILTISAATIGGTNAGDFATSADTCTGATVTPNGACTINVTFTPSAAGSRSASLNFTDNASNSPQTVALSGTGTVAAPVASLSPTTLSYQHNLNLQCPSKPLILSNTGGQTLQISSIVVAGPFAISANACGTTLASGASCEIDVSFTAEAPVNTYSGSLTITDNAQGSPHVVPLSGQVFPPCLMQSSATTQQLLRTTPAATFNVSDTQPSCHTAVVTMSCTNNAPATCVFNPPTINPGGSTVLTVQNLNALTTDNFSFTAEGTDKTNTTTVNLSVLLSDFSFTPYPTTATVSAGQTATYAITVAPVNGLTGVVQLACQGAPAGANCTVTPSSVTLTSNNVPSQVSVAVSTAGRSMGAPRGGPLVPGPGAPLRLFIELASLLALMALAGWAAISRHRGEGSAFARRRLRLGGWALAALALMLMAWVACGGGGGVGGLTSNSGTAAGTYSMTVTGTYASSTGQQTSLTHTQSLTLQVN